jgi:transposase InsO family protein
MGSVGDGYDNAMIESFWARMQVELLDQYRWKTRIELAGAIFTTWRSGYLGNLAHDNAATGWSGRSPR